MVLPLLMPDYFTGIRRPWKVHRCRLSSVFEPWELRNPPPPPPPLPPSSPPPPPKKKHDNFWLTAINEFVPYHLDKFLEIRHPKNQIDNICQGRMVHFGDLKNETCLVIEVSTTDMCSLCVSR